jgi:hypothetical protein
VNPSNAILCAGVPIIHEYEVKTATHMYPGIFVIRDTSDDNIKVGVTADLNVLGVLDVPSDGLRSEIYTQYEQARVLSGPCEVLVNVMSGATITAGITLLCGSGGCACQGSTIGAIVGRAKSSPGTATAVAGGDGATPSHWYSDKFVRVALLV